MKRRELVDTLSDKGKEKTGKALLDRVEQWVVELPVDFICCTTILANRQLTGGFASAGIAAWVGLVQPHVMKNPARHT